jgi:hypothetical protein
MQCYHGTKFYRSPAPAKCRAGTVAWHGIAPLPLAVWPLCNIATVGVAFCVAVAFVSPVAFRCCCQYHGINLFLRLSPDLASVMALICFPGCLRYPAWVAAYSCIIAALALVGSCIIAAYSQVLRLPTCMFGMLPTAGVAAIAMPFVICFTGCLPVFRLVLLQCCLQVTLCLQLLCVVLVGMLPTGNAALAIPWMGCLFLRLSPETVFVSPVVSGNAMLFLRLSPVMQCCLQLSMLRLPLFIMVDVLPTGNAALATVLCSPWMLPTAVGAVLAIGLFCLGVHFWDPLLRSNVWWALRSYSFGCLVFVSLVVSGTLLFVSPVVFRFICNLFLRLSSGWVRKRPSLAACMSSLPTACSCAC